MNVSEPQVKKIIEHCPTSIPFYFHNHIEFGYAYFKVFGSLLAVVEMIKSGDNILLVKGWYNYLNDFMPII